MYFCPIHELHWFIMRLSMCHITIWSVIYEAAIYQQNNYLSRLHGLNPRGYPVYNNYIKLLLNTMIYIDGLVQERHNSSALAMELHLSCTKPWYSILDGLHPVYHYYLRILQWQKYTSLILNIRSSNTIQWLIYWALHIIFSTGEFRQTLLMKMHHWCR